LFVKARIDPWKDETVIYTTEKALDKRQAELKELIEIKMFENARAIGVAAAHGDLSENSEWKFAIEERDMLRVRAAKMQDEISRARVITAESIAEDSVGIGSKVILKKVSDGSELKLTFLGPWDSDLTQNIFSYQTQLAQDLMGSMIGDTVSVRLGDNEAEYTIQRILPGL
ncbi:MAG: transcription elongation factor GreAB, partial [Planctomycetaceae bacterium]